MTRSELHEKISEVSKTIFSYCMAKTPTREEAEDLSQEILYELIKSAGSIRDDNAFYAFMWGVAGNVYKQWYPFLWKCPQPLWFWRNNKAPQRVTVFGYTLRCFI